MPLMASNLNAQRVAHSIRARLRANGVSQSTVAEVLGTSQAAVSRRLVGDVPLSVEDLDVIAQLLDVAIADLLEVQAIA